MALLTSLIGLRATASLDKGLFIKVTPSKTQVYEQEPVVLSFTVCSVYDVSDVEGKMPQLNGVHSKEIESSKMKVFHQETIGGRKYNTVLWSKYMMYPQVTGRIVVPGTRFNATVMKESEGDATEDFFNDRQHFTPTKVTVLSPSTTINVVPLPPAPADFSGGVGDFSISASIDKAKVKTGEPVVIKVVVSGNGNLKLIRQPKVVFPRDFTVYDTKVADSTRFTDEGYSGYMEFDYIAEPKNQGSYTIPAIAFTYFDLHDDAYKTIHTQPFSLKVAQGGTNEVWRADDENANRSAWQKIVDFFADNKEVMIFVAVILVCLLIVIAVNRGRRRF